MIAPDTLPLAGHHAANLRHGVIYDPYIVMMKGPANAADDATSLRRGTLSLRHPYLRTST